jgi:hypothetical protein
MDGENSQHSSDNSGGWQYKPEGTASSDSQQPAQDNAADHDAGPATDAADMQQPSAGSYNDSPGDSVEWSASEFIAHHKSFGWYAVLGLVTVVTGALVLLLTKDKISTGAVVFVAVVLGIVAARKPRTLPYKLDQGGLAIGNKFFDYGQFRSFALVDEGAFTSVMFLPLKRFMPVVTIYFEPQDEEKIVEILSNHLPLETHQLDPLDQLMRKIRF